MKRERRRPSFKPRPKLDARIRELFPTMSNAIIGKKLGVSSSTVNYRARRMGLSKLSGWQTYGELKKRRAGLPPPGTSQEINDLIADEYHRTPVREIAEVVGLSVTAVQTRASRRGIARPRAYLPKAHIDAVGAKSRRMSPLQALTEKQRRALAARYADEPNHVIADDLRINVHHLEAAARAMRLRKCAQFLMTARVYASPPRPVPSHMFEARRA